MRSDALPDASHRDATPGSGGVGHRRPSAPGRRAAKLATWGRAVAAAAAVVVLAPIGAAANAAVSYDPAVACPDGQIPDTGLAGAAGTHAAAAHCAAWHGLLAGTTAGTADLDHDITRAQLSVITTRLFGLTPDGSAPTPTFTDLTGSHWAADAIAATHQAAILHGRADGSFAPTAPVTTGQLATTLVRALTHLTAHDDRTPALPAAGPVPPGAAGSTHSDALGIAVAAGLLHGDTSGTIDPSAPVTRGQTLTVATRTLGGLVDAGIVPLPGHPTEVDAPDGSETDRPDDATGGDPDGDLDDDPAADPDDDADEHDSSDGDATTDDPPDDDRRGSRSDRPGDGADDDGSDPDVGDADDEGPGEDPTARTRGRAARARRLPRSPSTSTTAPDRTRWTASCR